MILSSSTGSSSDVWVLGVGMTKFHKPGRHAPDYLTVGKEAVISCMADAGGMHVFDRLDAAVASYCYGDPTCGQRVLLEVGYPGIPVFNTNNNCSSASSALYLGASLIRSGQHDAVLVFGFEQMERGLTARYPEKPSPIGRHTDRMHALGAPIDPVSSRIDPLTGDIVKMFACAAREYQEKYPHTPSEVWSEIAYKNRRHGSSNQRALFHGVPLPDNGAEGFAGPLLLAPISTSMCAYLATGASAALLVSDRYMESRQGSLTKDRWRVRLAEQAVLSDVESTFKGSFMDLIGCSLAEKAANQVYSKSGMRPHDVDILEVHDCFSANELFVYEALGLCGSGCGAKLVKEGFWRGNHFYTGGRWVVNASGGLESKGHPIGATGLAQCFELVKQLRGEAGPGQVPGDVKVALQHNYGIGSACVVSLYTRHDPILSARAKL